MAVEEAMEGHNAIISISSKSTAILTAIMSNSALHFGGRNGFTAGENSFPGGGGNCPPPRYIVKKGTELDNMSKKTLRATIWLPFSLRH
jgi:hypothetical protein